jgi:hypothetical protein
MSLLKDILYKVSIRTVEGSTDVEIKDIQIDSRKIKPGFCVCGGKRCSRQMATSSLKKQLSQEQ